MTPPSRMMKKKVMPKVEKSVVAGLLPKAFVKLKWLR